MIIPSILASAYLGQSIYLIHSLTLFHCIYLRSQGQLSTATWGVAMILTSLIASMTMNALVTSLIVFNIFRMFREVQSITTQDEKSLGVTGRRKLSFYHLRHNRIRHGFVCYSIAQTVTTLGGGSECKFVTLFRFDRYFVNI